MSVLRSIILLILALVNTKVLAGVSVEEAFLHNFIVPDVVSVAPCTLAKVTYKNAEAKLGNQLPIIDVVVEPEVTYEADCNQNYTLLMVDPDAPSRDAPLLRAAQHWLVVNIPGNDVKKGDTISYYLPPGAPPGTGPHRYIFLVYKQCSYIDMNAIQQLQTSIASRVCFSAEDFAKEYNLGNPVAGNFFEAAIKVSTDNLLGGLLTT